MHEFNKKIKLLSNFIYQVADEQIRLIVAGKEHQWLIGLLLMGLQWQPELFLRQQVKLVCQQGRCWKYKFKLN